MPFKKEVNLISNQTKKAIRYQKLKKKIRNSVMMLTAITLLINFLTISFFFILKQRLSINNTKIKSLNEAIASLDKNESYVITITDRADIVKALLKERKPFLKAITELESLLVPGFNLNSLDFGSAGELKITASCDDNQSLTDFNERLEKVTQQGVFSKTLYSSIGRSKAGKYDFSLELKR